MSRVVLWGLPTIVFVVPWIALVLWSVYLFVTDSNDQCSSGRQLLGCDGTVPWIVVLVAAFPLGFLWKGLASAWYDYREPARERKWAALDDKRDAS